jgi:hypothetical protein
MHKRFKKKYRAPHPKLKAALATLIALALSKKRRLILIYVADNGTTGLLDYADQVLDQGWETHFHQAADILSEAATTSAIETLDESPEDYSDQLVRNVEQHNRLRALAEAALLLGLIYDPGKNVAIPTITGWSIGQSLLDQLTKVVQTAETEHWSSAKLDQAIGEMSGFSAKRAEQMAHDSLSYIDGVAARTTAMVTGATEKRSECVRDNKTCPACLENAAMGWIGINQKFSGSDTEDTPHHPNCRCDVEYAWGRMPVEVLT